MKQTLLKKLSPETKLTLKRFWAGSRRTTEAIPRTVTSFGLRGLNFVLRRIGWDVDKQSALPAATPFSTKDLQALGAAFAQQQTARSAVPLVSIVMPVFNKANFTFQCLHSLVSAINLAEVELIVVDNSSTDQTASLLCQLENYLHVITNSDNRGFVEACNQGAAAARGEYLLFLNNDTVVLPGWLEYLLTTCETDHSVGAVGSLFLYPDGSIQEAGAIVWNSGEAFHYGWGQSPDDRRFKFVREVDYCSAASLLIRRNIFQQLGGFDQRFAPAYYEDVDLCMGVRELGYKVIYQPASKIIHYEGATAGRDTRTGIKHYQVINREKFGAKWQSVLEREHYPFAQGNVERAANRKRGKAVIVFDDRIPTPDRDAGSGRMFFVLQSLAKSCRVVFAYQSKPLAPSYEKALWQLGIETANVVDFVRLLKTRDFQTAIISRPEIAQAVLKSVRRRAPGIRIVFDMVDAYFLRLELEAQLTKREETRREAERYKSIELTLAAASDLVWCNSTEDKEAMQRELPGKPFVVVPTIHALRPRHKKFDQREGLLFVGHFSHRPNADAALFFLAEIYPLILRSLPSLELHLVGSNPPPEIQAYNSATVHVTGYVPDIEPFFQNARVFIAPLRFGAGVKGKIGDALSYGLPVVTTSVGASGMGFQNGTNALIADDPRDFARVVTELYRDEQLWQRLADQGYKHVEAHFSPGVVEPIVLASVLEPQASLQN